MTQQNKEKSIARPSPGRAFLSRFSKASLPSPKAHLIFWSLALIGAALDLWTKSAVFNWLQQRGDSFPVIDRFLQLVIAVNDGAAFGIASGQRYLLTAVSVAALIAIFAVFVFSGTERKLVHISLGLFAAGICGNLYDRIFNDGLVRDFIDVAYWPGRHWPAFNVADTMLCIAVGFMVISSSFTEKPSRKHAQQHK